VYDAGDGAIQIAIEDDNGGYRICGPKFFGKSRVLRRVYLDRATADAIQAYLERVPPDVD
jgi:hypothetical protein